VEVEGDMTQIIQVQLLLRPIGVTAVMDGIWPKLLKYFTKYQLAAMSKPSNSEVHDNKSQCFCSSMKNTVSFQQMEMETSVNRNIFNSINDKEMHAKKK